MNLYDYHKKPEDLKGHDERHEHVPDLIIDKIESRRKGAKPTFNQKEIESILKNPYLIFLFASYIIKGRWPEGEDALLKNSKRFSQKFNSKWVYSYIKDIIEGPWPQAEDIIAKDPWSSLYYAKDILNGKRFQKGEKVIVNNPYYSIDYARLIIKGPWPEAEKYFTNYIKNKTDAYEVAEYAKKWGRTLSPETNAKITEQFSK